MNARHPLLASLVTAAWLAAGGACAAALPAGGTANLEAELAAARARLDQATREVAELSAQLGVDEPPPRMRFRARTPDQAMLGIRIAGTAESRGVSVAAVSPDGPAAEAGIQMGDVIVALDGRSMAGGRDVVQAMQGVRPGGKVALDLRRHGKPLSVYVIARAAQPDFQYFDERLAAPGEPERLPGMWPLPPPPWSGDEPDDAEFATLTPKLGRYFGTEQGVLVVRAPADNEFRLEDGDVLQSIDGRVPQGGPHAMRILRSYQPGEKLTLQIFRQRKTQRIEVTIPAESGPRVRRPRSRVPSAAVPVPSPPR